MIWEDRLEFREVRAARIYREEYWSERSFIEQELQRSAQGIFHVFSRVLICAYVGENDPKSRKKKLLGALGSKIPELHT